MSDQSISAEMPRYKCHKEVWALKIANISETKIDGSAMMTPEDARYAPIRLDSGYMKKHNPQVGGYYVVYKDDYRSWSPASEFEEGYTLI